LGFREEGIVLLFGVKEWEYAGILGVFGPMPPDPRGMAIEVVLQIVLEFFAGSLGLLVALSATAFFVPRMLEKGSAELYFHKPISRWVLLLSRYFAGLLFVALVAGVLTTGMYLGLMLVSGHQDAGILVAALTLTYKFVPIYAFTVLAGVVMRSTVGSLLLSAFFFLFNGCIQTAWIQLETSRQGPSLFQVQQEAPAEDGGLVIDVEEIEEFEDEEPPGSGVLDTLVATLDALHFVLPKTADADYLGQKLRRAIADRLYHEPGSLVSIGRLPEGFTPVPEPELAALEPDAVTRTALGTPVLGARSEGLTFSLWTRAALREEKTVGDRTRTRVETPSQAAKSLEEALESAGAAGVSRDSAAFGSGLGAGQISGHLVRWSVGGRGHAALVFRGASDDPLFTLLADAPEASLAADADAVRDRLAAAIDVDEAAREEWYPKQLAFDAPLRFNILFSIGSTLAFAAALLGLACWRLARIAF
jgi:hypothetical protein